jgi:hypothetical protein
MKRFLIVSVFLALGIGSFSQPGQSEEQKGLKELMQRKLKHSQKVLEGLALKDFDLIANHAEELVLVSKTAEWKVVKTPKYELYSNEFRRNAEEMIQKAKEKNLDGATLAYVDMTLNCVKCHKYVRDVRMTKLEKNDREIPCELTAGISHVHVPE